MKRLKSEKVKKECPGTMINLVILIFHFKSVCFPLAKVIPGLFTNGLCIDYTMPTDAIEDES